MSVVSAWFVVALTVAAGSAWLLLLGARRGSRRDSPRWGRRAGVTVAAVLTLLAGGDGVNSYFSYWPQLSDVAEAATQQAGRPTFSSVAKAMATPHPGGVVSALPVPDGGSGLGASDALVYLPPQYFTDPEQRFPVVYLFHGSPGVPADWFEGGDAARTAGRAAAAGRPAIVVSPRMSRDWLDDPECVDGVREQVETHFLRDVVPTVDTNLRTLPDRDHRTLGGMSAGGYCALDLGLRHRDLAATIIDMSGLTEPTHTGGMGEVFGPDPAVVAARVAGTSPRDYAPSVAADPPTRIWFDVGTGDHETRAPIESVATVLRGRGLDVSLHERPGAHTFHVWAPALREALPWALGAPGGSDRPGP